MPPIAAEAPKATWAVPRIFSSSRMFPVSSASSLVPIPSSATLVPSSPWALSSSSSAGAVGAGRVGQVAAADGQRGRRVEQADLGDRAVDDERALGGSLDRGDEGLAAGQVAEGAAAAQFAGVDDPEPALEADPQVAAVAAGDPRLGAAVEMPLTTPSRAAAPRRGRWSSAGSACLRSLPAGCRCGPPPRSPSCGRRCGRATGSSAPAPRRPRPSPRRPARGGSAAGDSRSEITARVAIGAVALRLDPHQRADLFGDRVADDEHLLARRDAHALRGRPSAPPCRVRRSPRRSPVHSGPHPEQP